MHVTDDGPREYIVTAAGTIRLSAMPADNTPVVDNTPKHPNNMEETIRTAKS